MIDVTNLVFEIAHSIATTPDYTFLLEN